MEKKPATSKCHDEESACEVIELAINDINTLAAAFNSINEYCLTCDEGDGAGSGIPDHRLH